MRYAMSHMLRDTGTACAILLLVQGSPACAQPSFDRLWAELASTDEGTAARATLGLAVKPNETIPFLKKHLQPVKADVASIAKLVKQLDSEEFDQREAAAKELEYLGKYARPLLEKHAEGEVSAEAKR